MKRNIRKRENAERLKEIYTSTVSGTIKLTDRVVKLSIKYEEEVKASFGRRKTRDMEDDFRIVASAAVANLKAVATFNRKTMANEEIIELYERVNKSNNLKTPRFLKTRESLFSFLSSL